MAKKFAIIRAKGKQLGLEEGQTFDIDQLEGDVGSKITFSEVLMYSADGQAQVGAPMVANATVTAKIVSHFRGKKLIAYRKNITHGFTKKIGHRQYRTRLVVESISA